MRDAWTMNTLILRDIVEYGEIRDRRSLQNSSSLNVSQTRRNSTKAILNGPYVTYKQWMRAVLYNAAR